MSVGDNIRVLIVDDIAETRDNVRKLLQFENNVEVVGSASSGHEGVSMAKEKKPDVILMDINMPDLDGITATEMIRKSIPFAQIIILSVQGDPNYMRRAMMAGARDFLTKPPTVDELTSAIKRAGKVAHSERAKGAVQTGALNKGPGSLTAASGSYGKVISVYSPKGGTGSTTVAVNLAMALHNEETSVMLVDGNLQFGDIGVFLNEQGNNSIIDLAPRVEELDPEIVQEVSVLHKSTGARILLAPSRPEYAENVSGDQFASILEYLRKMYSYIVVDNSSALSDVTLASVDASDIIILLTTQDIPAIKNARLFLDITDALGINKNRVLFVMNRYDKRIGITPDRVSDSFKHKITCVIPTDERIVIPSVNRGVPFILNDKSKPVSRAVLALAEAVREKVTNLAEQSLEEEKQLSGVS